MSTSHHARCAMARFIYSLSVKVLNFRKFILKNSIFLFKGFPLAAGQSAYATKMLLVIIVVL
jgi:hypothetical protein